MMLAAGRPPGKPTTGQEAPVFLLSDRSSRDSCSSRGSRGFRSSREEVNDIRQQSTTMQLLAFRFQTVDLLLHLARNRVAAAITFAENPEHGPAVRSNNTYERPRSHPGNAENDAEHA